MKKHHLLKIWVNLGLIFLFLGLILSITNPQSTWRLIMLFFWGAISLSQMAFLIRQGPFSVLLSWFNLYLGSLLLMLFSIWSANLILKVFNPLFSLLDWSFRIGNLFNGDYHYLFSLPALICGVLLVVSAFLSQPDGKYYIMRFGLKCWIHVSNTIFGW